MRIVLVSETYPPSANGAAYFTQRLGRALQGRGHQVSILTPSSSGRSTTVKDSSGVVVYGLPSVPVFTYPGLRISPRLLAGRRVRATISRLAPDIVHIQNHFFIGRLALATAQDLGIPVVGTNHFIPKTLTVHAPIPRLTEGPLAAFLWHQVARVYRQLDTVTAPTRFASEVSERAGLGAVVVPISNGISLQRFKPGASNNSLRARYSVPNRPVLLCVGRLDKEKRLEIILRAMPGILGQCEVHLVVAGVGTQRKKLFRLVTELGLPEHVTFTGYVPDEDMPSLYRLATVFVMPGNAEMQSIATMEAMASGLPVLAADAAALPELVHDGDNGFLFRDGDSAGLARSAVRLLRHGELRQRMGRRSLEIIRSHSLENVVVQFEALYKGTVLRKRLASHVLAPVGVPSWRTPTKMGAWARAALVMLTWAGLIAGGLLQPWRPGHLSAKVKEGLLDDTGIRATFERLEHVD